ncbi:hypothetical protein YB2330_001084 [Saitoella coloradoensis]
MSSTTRNVYAAKSNTSILSALLSSITSVCGGSARRIANAKAEAAAARSEFRGKACALRGVRYQAAPAVLPVQSAPPEDLATNLELEAAKATSMKKTSARTKTTTFEQSNDQHANARCTEQSADKATVPAVQQAAPSAEETKTAEQIRELRAIVAASKAHIDHRENFANIVKDERKAKHRQHKLVRAEGKEIKAQHKQVTAELAVLESQISELEELLFRPSIKEPKHEILKARKIASRIHVPADNMSKRVEPTSVTSPVVGRSIFLLADVNVANLKINERIYDRRPSPTRRSSESTEVETDVSSLATVVTAVTGETEVSDTDTDTDADAKPEAPRPVLHHHRNKSMRDLTAAYADKIAASAVQVEGQHLKKTAYYSHPM